MTAKHAGSANSGRRKARWTALACVVLAATACGARLDGPVLVYRFTTESGEDAAADVATRATTVIERRLAALDPAAAWVEQDGGTELRVRLARGADAGVAAMIRASVEPEGILEIRLCAPPDVERAATEAPGAPLPPGFRRVPWSPQSDEFGGPAEAIVEFPEDLASAPDRDTPVRADVFTDLDLASASAQTQGMQHVVEIAFSEPRATAFADFTERSVRRRLAILVDGRVICAPRINDRLPGGGVISGSGAGFTEAEARAFAATVSQGRLPCRLEFVREEAAPR